MKFFARVAVSAALVVVSGGANAQMLGANDLGRAHYQAASDFDGPYGPPPLPPAPAPRPYGYGPGNDYAPHYGYGPRYGAGPQYGDAPALMPLPDVYAVLRESGFSPLGIPHQRGFVYVIAALDRGGQDGRLVIDGRNGQIIRFTPAWRWGSVDMRMRDERLPPPPYGAQAALPPPGVIREALLPPVSLPQAETRNAPVPPARPATSGKPAATSQQSAAVETKPLAASSPPQAAAAPPPNATIGQSRPAPQILPTQEMPKAQGLE